MGIVMRNEGGGFAASIYGGMPPKRHIPAFTHTSIIVLAERLVCNCAISITACS